MTTTTTVVVIVIIAVARAYDPIVLMTATRIAVRVAAAVIALITWTVAGTTVVIQVVVGYYDSGNDVTPNSSILTMLL